MRSSRQKNILIRNEFVEEIMRAKLLGFVVIAGLLGAIGVPAASGQNQPSAGAIAALQARIIQFNTTVNKLRPNHRTFSSALPLRQLGLAGFSRFAAAAAVGKPLTPRRSSHPGAGNNNPLVASVNDNSTDLDLGSFDGVTQSTTSTARCGNQVVVGFNDFGSYVQSVINTFDPATFNLGPITQTGAAVSSDGGRTFQDIGSINPGSDPTNFMIGEPVLACTDPSTFYYAQVFAHGGFQFFQEFNSISVSKSNDGGNTWGEPVAAIDKDSFHYIDKPWIAADPSNPQRIYVTYTDFDFDALLGSPSPGCGFQTRTAIELVISNDGGQTFPNNSNPIIIDEVCGDDSVVTSPHVAFNSHGVAYLAWQRMSVTNFGVFGGIFQFTYPPGASEVRVTHVASDGTIAPSVVVDQKVMGGDTFVVEHGANLEGFIQLETDLQGQFRDLYGLDLAVDHSGGPNDGTVYVTWDDGRNKSVPDLAGFQVDWTNPTQVIAPLLAQFPNAQVNLPFTPLLLTSGSYQYTDVLVSKAKDGVHFGPTMQVNSDLQPKVGGGHDHFQPAIATDGAGNVAICWYDRRNDPRNFNIERFCAKSPNGKDWDNFKVPIAPFAPIHRLDFELACIFCFETGTFFDPFVLGQDVGIVSLLNDYVDMRYMGDYDGLTTDFTGKFKGFIGAFQWMSSGMNPDVKSYRF